MQLVPGYTPAAHGGAGGGAIPPRPGRGRGFGTIGRRARREARRRRHHPRVGLGYTEQSLGYMERAGCHGALWLSRSTLAITVGLCTLNKVYP
jgi:hypothetical protein